MNINRVPPLYWVENSRTPSSAQIRTVIDNFKKVLPLAPSILQLNMKETRVNEDGHACGTTHRHGGWYAVATVDNVKKIPAHYLMGTEQMAKDLGFSGLPTDYMNPFKFFNVTHQLLRWAGNSPILWGNENGSDMFSSASAFTSGRRLHGAKTLADIVDHWEEVYQRVALYEETAVNPRLKPENDDLIYAVGLPMTEFAEIMERSNRSFSDSLISRTVIAEEWFQSMQPSVPAVPPSVEISDPPITAEQLVESLDSLVTREKVNEEFAETYR